jgi:hypothetical protein
LGVFVGGMKETDGFVSGLVLVEVQLVFFFI